MECSLDPCEMRTTETPSARSAPKSLLAMPGTPTMPVPSTLTSVMPSTLAKPLTAEAEDESAEMVVPAAVGAEGVLDVDGDAARDDRRHRVRVDDLRAEVGQLGRLRVGERGDDERVGDAARVRA